MGLCLTVRSGDIIKIGDSFLSLEKKGSIWRVLIQAPKEVLIQRLKAVPSENGIAYKQVNKKGKNETN